MKIENQIAKKVIILAMNLHSVSYYEGDREIGAHGMDWYDDDFGGEKKRRECIVHAIECLINMEIFDESHRELTDDIVALSEMNKWNLIK